MKKIEKMKIGNYLSKEDFELFINTEFEDVHPSDMDKAYEKWWDENKPNNLPRDPKKYYIYYL